MKRKKTRKSPTEIISVEELENSLKEEAAKRKYFKYYSSIDHINKVVEDKALYMSDGRNWNDINDREKFNKSNIKKKQNPKDNSKIRRFGMCFGGGRNENVAMWMLYSKSTGAMIDLRRKDFQFPEVKKTIKGKKKKKVNKKVSIIIGEFKDKKFIELEELMINAKRIYFIDIAYGAINNLNVTKSSDVFVRTYKYISRKKDNNTDSFIGANKNVTKKYFVKDVSWHYEEEIRLVVEIDSKKLEKYKNKELFVRIPLNSDELESKVYLTPIKHKKCNKYKDSNLRNKIDWSLNDLKDAKS